MRYLLSFSLIFLMSCASFKNSGKLGGVTELSSTSWILTSIVAFEMEQTPKPVTLSFTDSGRVGGNAGCNGYGGNYTVDKQIIAFGPMMATKMACIPGMKTENQFFNVLQHANKYEVIKKRLILKEDDKILATFSKKEK